MIGVSPGTTTIAVGGDRGSYATLNVSVTNTNLTINFTHLQPTDQSFTPEKARVLRHAIPNDSKGLEAALR